MVRLAKNKYINVFLGIKLKNKKKKQTQKQKESLCLFFFIKKNENKKKKTCFFHIGFVLPQNKLMNE